MRNGISTWRRKEEERRRAVRRQKIGTSYMSVYEIRSVLIAPWLATAARVVMHPKPALAHRASVSSSSRHCYMQPCVHAHRCGLGAGEPPPPPRPSRSTGWAWPSAQAMLTPRRFSPPPRATHTAEEGPMAHAEGRPAHGRHMGGPAYPTGMLRTYGRRAARHPRGHPRHTSHLPRGTRGCRRRTRREGGKGGVANLTWPRGRLIGSARRQWGASRGRALRTPAPPACAPSRGWARGVCWPTPSAARR
jgi:hypothetical protein